MGLINDIHTDMKDWLAIVRLKMSPESCDSPDVSSSKDTAGPAAALHGNWANYQPFGMRVWFLGGSAMLKDPNTDTLLCCYVPIYLEHKPNLKLAATSSRNALVYALTFGYDSRLFGLEHRT